LLERYAEEQISDFKAIMKLDPAATRDAINLWLDTMNADIDWDVVTMELQLHARRNPEFAERFYALEERLTKFYADILADGSLGRDASLRLIRVPFRWPFVRSLAA